MDPETTDLVAALKTLQRQIPQVCLAMIHSQLDADQQIDFGDLLIQLGQLIQQHANDSNVFIIESDSGSMLEIAANVLTEQNAPH